MSEGAVHEGSGTELANWLADNPEVIERQGRFLIHSLNREGRKRMCRAIRQHVEPAKCREAPFMWLSNKFYQFF